MYYRQVTLLFLLVALLICSASGVSARDEGFENVRIQTVKAAGNVYMLAGRGGNIGVCAGPDGAFLVDDQFAPLTEKIRQAVSRTGTSEIRFVLNTHWHADHVGGNEALGESGSVIVAHENVRKRMDRDQFMAFFNKKVPRSPRAALPVITFTKDIRFHLNNEEIEVTHMINAHTDGDAIVHFKKANVIHTGDIYFAGIYPFIDVESKGSVNGMIDAVNHILSIIDEKTVVIPGHGPISNKAELKAYVKMLKKLRDKVQTMVLAKKTLRQIQATRPTKAFDATWGDGFLSPDRFTEILYNDLAGIRMSH